MTATLSGCQSLSARNTDAAITRAVMEATVDIPNLPADCRIREPHAPLVKGSEVRSVLKRERAALEKANSRIDRCAKFYDEVRERF